MRMQIGAINLANSNTTRTQNGELYKPLTVLSTPKYTQDFEAFMSTFDIDGKIPSGVEIDGIEPIDVAPRIVYQPSHPDADKNGYVQFPNINPVTEMVNLINITRSYEANVRAFNASKRMYQSAMDIGGR